MCGSTLLCLLPLTLYRRLDEVVTDALGMLYEVGEGDRGEAMAYCPHLDDMISPEELSSWLLQHLVRQAEQQLQERVDGAVGGPVKVPFIYCYKNVHVWWWGGACH